MIEKIELGKLRPKLLEKLRDTFVIDISSEDDIVISEKTGKRDNSNLNNVKINNLQSILKNNKAWRINLEELIDGLSSSQKTVELAIILPKNKNLDIYLIELKSSISSKVLKETRKKFIDSANRIYFLLMLNDNSSHESFSNYRIRFKGCVFYNGNNNFKRDELGHEFEDIIGAFEKSTGGSINAELILGNQLIPTEFFCYGFNNGIIEIEANKFIELFKRS